MISRGRPTLHAQLYGLAAQMAPDYVFPHRLEELAILTRALDANPGDAQAWAYRGTLLYALRRQDEARADWRRSLVIKPMAVTYRNLGKSLWKDCADLAGAREQYECAIALNSQDHRLYSDLADILTELGAPVEQRVALLERAPRHGRVQARLAAALVALKQWDRAIRIMQTMQYDPYEGERDTRPAYYEATSARLERYESGDLAGALSDFEAAVGVSSQVRSRQGTLCSGFSSGLLGSIGRRCAGRHEIKRNAIGRGAAIRFRPQDDDLVSPFEGINRCASLYEPMPAKVRRAEEAARLF
jgi:tetratricopeptide (TPR) repeat protein